MKAIMPTILPDVAAWRKRIGADQWDEIWEEVLHMPPAPNREHQDLEGWMETYLRGRWVPRRRGRVYHQINLAPPGGWPDRNYRIPDLVLLLPDRFSIDKNEYFEGAPSVVVEIHSEGDEAYDKLPFYAELGVPEVWIIDRDTKEPEIRVLRAGRYVRKRAGRDGWLTSEATGVELRVREGILVMRVDGDEATEEELST